MREYLEWLQCAAIATAEVAVLMNPFFMGPVIWLHFYREERAKMEGR